MYEVMSVGIHDSESDTVTLGPGGATGMQVRMTTVSVDPGAVVVDTEKVVNWLSELPTSVLVRVGVETHVVAMLE